MSEQLTYEQAMDKLEETLKRMEAFDERKEQFVASVRKGKS